jgi:hypothetical protein
MAKQQSKNKKFSLWRKFQRAQIVGAEKTLLEELLQDMYAHRRQIYQINFVRGLFFGLGSVLGGTILIALLVWLLPQLGAIIPFLSDFIQDILDALSSRGR